MSWEALSEPPVDAPPAAPGWFGKVVMLGDFGHRRLPQEFIAVCDPWLSRCVSSSRAQLGPGWLDTYLTAPLWQFAWAPGVVDEQWWFGVLMPSVDAVGRYFPLVICASDLHPPMSAAALDGLSRWYSHAGRAALATLQPGTTVEDFEADLARSPQWQDSSTKPARNESETTAAGRRHVQRGKATLLEWAPLLIGPAFADKYARHSLWIPSRAEQGTERDSSLTVVPGLPDPDEFALMLEGQW